VNPLILIDTSSWVHFMRTHGDPDARRRVETALRTGEACWCPLIQLELWNGARRNREAKVLRHLESVLVSLPMDGKVWRRAWSLARHARSRGITVPAADIAIAACAQRHGAAIESVDGDFARLAILGSAEDA